MIKPISRPMHGLITDYPYVALVSTAPSTVGFEDERTATRLCHMLSGSILMTSLFTRAEWGLFRVIPYKMHLSADMALGVFALASPWVFGFSHNARARNTLVAAGAFGMMAGMLSKPREMKPDELPAPRVRDTSYRPRKLIEQHEGHPS